MTQKASFLLTINSGSSSLKFALYQLDAAQEINAALKRRLAGKIERIGLPGTTLTFEDLAAVDRAHARSAPLVLGDCDHATATNFLLDWLDQTVGLHTLSAAGHRIVHGGPHHFAPQRLTPELLEALRRNRAYAPTHLPAELAVIDHLRERLPDLPQTVCFDTAFHRAMPQVARTLPIPRRWQAAGIERYGFHGLSYASLMQTLARTVGSEAAQGRVILAHLGNGASLAAVHGGVCRDTSMAFTPAAGVMMGTRSGDLDPGLASYLADTENMSTAQFQHMVNHESGLLGVSETSADVRDLLACEARDPRAAEALALFCYQIKKCIGAYAAVLGGLDTLVFAGGIGENAPLIRARICDGLQWLGVEIAPEPNAANAHLISAASSRVAVRVIATDEETMIAQSTAHVLGWLTPEDAP